MRGDEDPVFERNGTDVDRFEQVLECAHAGGSTDHARALESSLRANAKAGADLPLRFAVLFSHRIRAGFSYPHGKEYS